MSIKLRYINNALATLVILLGLYIIFSPLLPLVAYKAQAVSRAEEVKKETLKLSEPAYGSDIPADNRLRIPSLFLEEKINRGSSIGVINKGGTWLRPNSAKPSEPGNSVIVGHRFTYDGPATFYNLDKLANGDKIAVFWEGQRFVYEVSRVFVTNLRDTEIEAASIVPELTLYTCTPLWSARDRLVVKARLLTL